MKMFRRLINHVPLLLGLLFLYSGVFKLISPGEAELALKTLGFNRTAALAVVASTVVEMYLGFLLVSGLDLLYSLKCSVLLMSLFTSYLFYLSMLAHPPTCGCVGLVGIFNSNKQAAVFGLLRNCLILWALKLVYESQTMAEPT